MNEPKEDLSPYLKKGLHYRLASVLYRIVFQPIDNLLDRLSAHFTRQWCEDNSKALREQNARERLLKN